MDQHTCDVCNTTFSASRNLYRHKREKHGDNERHGCPICPKSFTRNSDLERHASVHNKIAKPDFPRNPICGICSRECKNRHLLIEHLRTHENVFECRSCKASFTRQQNLNRHLRLQRCKTLMHEKFEPGHPSSSALEPSTATPGPSTSADSTNNRW